MITNGHALVDLVKVVRIPQQVGDSVVDLPPHLVVLVEGPFAHGSPSFVVFFEIF